MISHAANPHAQHLDGMDGEFVWPAEQPLPEPARRTVALIYNISPGYLQTAGTRLQP